MLQGLNLRLGKDAWKLYQVRRNDERFAGIKEKVFHRDSNQCQFCGFQSDIYMSVVNLDHNYRNNLMSNMITACPLCTQVQFIEMIGKSNDTGGVIIYLPEISQAQLNASCHTLFCAIANSGEHAKLAQEIYNSFKLRSKHVEKSLGKGLSDPSMLGQMLIDTPLDHPDFVYKETMQNLRVLPLLDAFATQIKEWSQSALTNLV